jgi:CubicO group peptidase (beta-lactamase class C family)
MGMLFITNRFGFQTYDSIKPVANYHLYDIASLTKIMSTTLAMMKLYETGKVNLDDKIGLYLPWLKGSDKEKLKIKDIMLHQAGLTPFIPFYKKTLVAGQLNPNIYSKTKDSTYTIQVADSIFIHKDYEKEIWSTIANSELKTQGNYVYSDLGFMMLRKVIEVISNQDFETYLRENIYSPLKLSSMVFNPTKTFNRAWIVPTELDTTFKKTITSGIRTRPCSSYAWRCKRACWFIFKCKRCGNYYANAFKWRHIWRSVQIFKSSTVNLFTKKQMKKGNRRGLGFDKPETEPEKASPTSLSCSPQTFGHTGFTGTCTWADPKNNLVFVFLSNRINPSAENKKLTDLNVRTRLQDAIYEAVRKK